MSLLFWRTIMPAILVLGASSARAQMPTPPAATPTVIDTAIVEIILPEGAANCVSITTSGDTLGFGVVGEIELGFAEEVVTLPSQELEPTESWLLVADAPRGGDVHKISYEIRAYRLQPFRIKIGSVLGPVVHISGSTGDLNETAAIRMPGVWGTRWWLLLMPAIVLAALVVGLYLLWIRRLQLETLQQWEPSPPAWLAAAVELRGLLDTDYPSADSVRGFMDRLANISRGYLAGRYLVPAGEMTGREILAKCLRKGHDSRALRNMIKILEGLDHQRYNPELPDASWSRQQAVDLLDAMEEVRILPKFTFVDPALLIEAEKAWAWLSNPENHPSGLYQSGGVD